MLYQPDQEMCQIQEACHKAMLKCISNVYYPSRMLEESDSSPPKLLLLYDMMIKACKGFEKTKVRKDQKSSQRIEEKLWDEIVVIVAFESTKALNFKGSTFYLLHWNEKEA